MPPRTMCSCGTRFANEESLELHLRQTQHAPPLRYSCDICSKPSQASRIYYSQTAYENHQLDCHLLQGYPIMSSEQPLAQLICELHPNRVFKDAAALKAHLRSAKEHKKENKEKAKKEKENKAKNKAVSQQPNTSPAPTPEDTEKAKNKAFPHGNWPGFTAEDMEKAKNNISTHGNWPGFEDTQKAKTQGRFLHHNWPALKSEPLYINIADWRPIVPKDFVTARDPVFECNVCHLNLFRSAKALEAHKVREKHDPTYYCEECKTGFTTKSNLDQHKTSLRHKNFGKFTCDCGSTFRSPSGIFQHLESDACKCEGIKILFAGLIHGFTQETKEDKLPEMKKLETLVNFVAREEEEEADVNDAGSDDGSVQGAAVISSNSSVSSWEEVNTPTSREN